MSLADLPPGQNAEQVRNHWWWCPGWHVGRRFFAFHITFDNQPSLHELAATYRTALAEMPSLTLIPDQWLHLTMQGIGFADEIQPAVLSQLVEEARNLLSAVPAFEAEFGSVIVADEAIVMPAEPPEPVQELRRLSGLRLAACSAKSRCPKTPTSSDLTSASPTSPRTDSRRPTSRRSAARRARRPARPSPMSTSSRCTATGRCTSGRPSRHCHWRSAGATARRAASEGAVLPSCWGRKVVGLGPCGGRS